MTSWQAQLDRAVDDLYGEMVAVRRHLHAHPEPSGEEHQTSMFLYRRLFDAGLDVRIGPEGRGVIVDHRNAASPRIAVRGDIDALRIQDRKSVEYRSQVPAVMHACGHDAHSATVLGTVLALERLERDGLLPWPISWRGIFQPAEETGKGALEMIDAGAMDGVAALVALHVDPSRAVGRIGVRTGAFTASCDELHIRIEGRGGHAARPHESIDPIAAAAQLISTIYLFIPRTVDSSDPVVVTIGQIQGGDNANVIPETVELHGTLRTLGGASRENTKAHLVRLARGVAEASGSRISVDFEVGPSSLVNDATLTALFTRAGEELLGPEHVDAIHRPSMGGEDLAYYQDHVPIAMFRLGCKSAEAGGPPLHSPVFDIDERAMAIGAKVLARSMIEWADPGRRGTSG